MALSVVLWLACLSVDFAGQNTGSLRLRQYRLRDA